MAQALDIDKKAQGYERLRAFESAADSADGYLADALTSPKTLAAFEQVHQRIMRVYKNPLVSAIAGPFLPDFLSKHSISLILRNRSQLCSGRAETHYCQIHRGEGKP